MIDMSVRLAGLSLKHSVSFILPSLNEAVHIKGVINSIREHASCLHEYEIIVVDNGSTDGTIQIAYKCGVRVYSKPGLSVGAIRNFGASIAKHDYIVFLDADVFLSSMWAMNILKVLDYLQNNGNIIAGSTCGISDNPSLIETCWWGHAKAKKNLNYINSGHMIVSRMVFQKLGGFDERLKTGEDAEFCQRKREVKVEIYHDPTLRVIHKRYPKTWYQFFMRERWHGLGDFSSISLFIRSKPAVIATTQATLMAVASYFALTSSNFYWLMLYPLYIIPISFLAAYKRTFTVSCCLVVNTALYILYFWARFFSLFDSLLKRKYIQKKL
jgi:glycosyltransferase involved in cell wall biosynthesis